MHSLMPLSQQGSALVLGVSSQSYEEAGMLTPSSMKLILAMRTDSLHQWKEMGPGIPSVIRNTAAHKCRSGR